MSLSKYSVCVLVDLLNFLEKRERENTGMEEEGEEGRVDLKGKESIRSSVCLGNVIFL